MPLSHGPGAALKPAAQPLKSILLIVVAGIGDFVMATPAIRAVRSGHPKVQLHLLTSTEAAALARRHPGVDRVLAFPIRELRTNRFKLRPLLSVLHELRRTSYDVAVNLYPVCSWLGSLRMALLFGCLKARHKVGHAPGVLKIILPRLVPDETFSGKHRVDAMTDIGLLVGAKRDEGGVELAASLCGRDDPRGWGLPEAGAGAKTIGINPGGDRANRRWPAGHFAAVGQALANLTGARIVIFGGPGEESIAAEIMQRLNGVAVNLAGRLALEQLPGALSCCDLLITNDSGPMHIAAALKVPVVALFGPEDPALFGPCSSPERSRVLQKAVPCRPCPHTSCAQPICLQRIYPSEVLAASLDLLGKTSSANAADCNAEAG